MTHNPNTPMQRYHDRFDSAQYNAIGEFLASNLNADREESRVVDILVALHRDCRIRCLKSEREPG